MLCLINAENSDEKQKLQRGEEENLAGNYFSSNRASEILSRVHNDVYRATRKSNTIAAFFIKLTDEKNCKHDFGC